MSWKPLTQPAAGGTSLAVAFAPGGKVLMGSDMQGVYWSSDYGVHWAPKNRGMGPASYNHVADVAYSITESNTWYAVSGDGGGGGGLLAMNESDFVWHLRSSKPGQSGNDAPGASGKWPRAAGRRIIQDGTWMYVSAYNNGVFRSDCTSPAGSDNFPTLFGSTGSGYWYGIDYDPSTGCLYACHYHDGLWKCTSPHAGSPGFTKLGNSPGGANDVRAIDGAVYVACDTGAGTGGIWRSLDDGATWTQLANAAIDTSQVWNYVDCVVDGTAHRLVVSTGKTNDAGVSLVFITIPSHGAGTPSYRPLVPGNVDHTFAPDGDPPWAAMMQLGQPSGIKFAPRYDTTDSALQRIYCPGENGFYRSTDGGVHWQQSSIGADMFRVQAGFPACDPNDKNHMIFGSGDWGSFIIEDGIGAKIGHGMCTRVSGAGAPQGHTACFDPADGESFMSFGDKFSTVDVIGGSGGTFARRAKGVYSWTQINPPTSKIATGAICIRQGSTKVVLTAHLSWGIGRWTPGGGWTHPSSSVFTSDQNINIAFAYTGSGIVFCWDRKQGIYRSNDYGVTWSRVWATPSGSRHHHIAADPTRFGEIWVSCAQGVYRLTGADTGTVEGGGITAAKMSSGSLSGNGPVACGPDGTVYVVTMPNPYDAGCWMSRDRGATWTNLDPDHSLACLDSMPCHLAVAADNRLYLGGSNVVNWAYPGGGGVSVPAITTTSLPGGTVGVAYSQTVTGTGGTTPYTFTISAGALPGGLSLSPAGVISGTPTTTTGSPFSFTVRLTDAAAQTATKALSITIAAGSSPVSITTTSLPAGTVSSAYSQTLAATGGTSPYTWEVTSGSVPPGLSLSSGGVLSGTPTLAGSYPFTVTATDSATPTAGTASRAFTVAVSGSGGGSISQPFTTVQQGGMVIASSGAVRLWFSQTGGVPSTAGTLLQARILSVDTTATVTPPAGWTLAADSGNHAGGPRVRLYHYLGNPGGLGASSAAGETFTSTETGAAWRGRMMEYSSGAGTTQYLDQAGTAYGGTASSYPVTASAPDTYTGGLATAFFGVSLSVAPSGSWTTPADWSQEGWTGNTVLCNWGGKRAALPSGTISVTGTFSTSANVTGWAGALATYYATPAGGAALAVTTSSLPDGQAGSSYSQAVGATGGTPPYTWAVTAGALPGGLTLHSSTGVIDGTPDTAGTFAFTVTCTDSATPTPATATADLSITIAAGSGGGTSAAFTFVQDSSVVAAAAGDLGLWFSQTGGVPSTAGTLLLAFIEYDNPAADVTPPDGWSLAVDASSADTAPACRFMIFYREANPGGLGAAPGQGNYHAGVFVTPFLTAQNASFEGGIGTWIGGGNAVTAASTAQAHGGSGALRMTSQAAGDMTAAHCAAANITVQGLPVTPGQSVPVTGWVRATSAARSCNVGAHFYTAAGILITGGAGVVFGASPVTSSTSAWTQVTGTVTVPATAAYARCALLVSGTAAAGETCDWDDVTFGSTTLADNLARFETVTGRPVTVRREYYAASQFPGAVTADLTADAAAGRKVCLTLRPACNPVDSGERTAMDTFLASCKAAGVIMDITLWHEPYYDGGLTAQQYKDMVTYYGPTVRQYYPLVFVTSMGSVTHNNENSYYPGDDQIDKIATDLYAADYTADAAQRLDLAAAVADAAVPPKPFGVWEFNASTDPLAGQTQPQGQAFFAYIRAFFAARAAAGKPNADLLLFNAYSNHVQETQIQTAADYRVAAYQGIYDDAAAASTVQTFTSSDTAASYTFKGHLAEFSTPAGTRQHLDQAGHAGAHAAAGTFPVSAPANAWSSDLGVSVFGARYSTAPGGQTWPTPAGWSKLASSGNVALGHVTLYKAGLAAGVTSVTETLSPTANMTDWVAGLATFYAASVTADMQITTTSLPAGTAGVVYAGATLAVTGGIAPYTWTVAGGALPGGLSLSSGGVLSGTPADAGDFPVTIQAADSAGGTAQAGFSVHVAAALTVTTGTLPDGTAGISYQLTVLTATGGTPPYLWTVTAGALPDGMSLSPGGTLTGTPLAAGTYSITVQVRDTTGTTGTADLTVTVAAASPDLAITTTTLPPATLGQPYTATLTATGGTPPYTWAVTAGMLPPGLALTAANLAAGTSLSVGAFLDPAAMGQSGYPGAIAAWESWTGMTLKVRRDYFALSDFTVVSKSTTDAAAGRKNCITLRPAYNPVSATDRTNMATMLSTLKAAGLAADVTLWHEPYWQGLTAQQYKDMVTYYGPTVRQYYPLVFCPAVGSAHFNNELSYYPGDDQIDKIAADYYAINLYDNNLGLGEIAALANAANPPKPFGVWEWNANTSTYSQAQVMAFVNGMLDYMHTRERNGLPNADVLIFNGSGPNSTIITSGSDYRVTLYQNTGAVMAGTPDWVISGTPSLVGSWTFTVTVTDTTGAHAYYHATYQARY